MGFRVLNFLANTFKVIITSVTIFGETENYYQLYIVVFKRKKKSGNRIKEQSKRYVSEQFSICLLS